MMSGSRVAVVGGRLPVEGHPCFVLGGWNARTPRTIRRWSESELGRYEPKPTQLGMDVPYRVIGRLPLASFYSVN